MAHYDLEEQEQIDTLKTWWKMHGNRLTSVVTALAVGLAAWQGWNWHQRTQSAEASAVFAVLEDAVAANDGQRIKTLAGELTEKYPATAAAALGALLASKQSFEAGDLKTARLQLDWVVKNGPDEIAELARLRLAAVLLDDKDYDTALKTLETKPSPAFAARFSDLKGDIFAAQGKKAEARTAYQAAVEKLDEKTSAWRDLVQQKIDHLGEAA